MIDKLLFLNGTWNWPVLLGSAVLLLVFIWKERDQFGSPRFYFKVLVAFLAILSLAMIALRPALLNIESTGNLLLLTEGYEQISLDSLKKEHKKIKILKYEADISILNELKGIDSIFILGHGVRGYDLWQLEGKSTKYIPSGQLTGITKFKYQPDHVLGDKAVFQGLYSRPTSGNTLLLEGPGGQVMDSLILREEKEQRFNLTAELKSAGNFVFSLVEKDSLGVLISTNPIPLRVTKKEALKILIINGFPTFETKYLKNFLAEMDHEVIVRSQVTRGRFKYEYFNTEKTALGKISEKLLESYDLLIIDFNSFKTLSTSEKNAVERSIREYGLGVFIQPETGLFRSNSGLASFDVIPENGVEVSLQENVRLTKYPFSFKPGLKIQPIETFNKQILSASKRKGQGKIGSSVLENTYELLLGGHTFEYQHLWTKLINAISKRAVPLAEWSSVSGIGVPDEPFQFQVRTFQEEPTVLNAEESIIPLRRDIDIPDLWTGITYPKSTGWQQLSLQQDSAAVYNFYVANSEAWKTVRAYERIQENLRNSNSSNLITKRTTNQAPINLLYFYLIFMLCMSYLWLEPKMRSH